MIEIIDDYLPVEDFIRLQQIVLSESIPWVYQDCVNFPGDGHEQFVHGVYTNYLPISPFFEEINNILLAKLRPIAIIKIKINLNPRHKDLFEYGYHIDETNYPEGMKTGILYFNSNNGYTGFKDGTKIENIPNRFVSFDGGMLHTGTTATDDRRVVLNINYIEAGLK